MTLKWPAASDGAWPLLAGGESAVTFCHDGMRYEVDSSEVELPWTRVRELKIGLATLGNRGRRSGGLLMSLVVFAPSPIADATVVATIDPVGAERTLLIERGAEPTWSWHLPVALDLGLAELSSAGRLDLLSRHSTWDFLSSELPLHLTRADFMTLDLDPWFARRLGLLRKARRHVKLMIEQQR